jgi:hypothetical protein
VIRFGPKATTPESKPVAKAEKPVEAAVTFADAAAAKPVTKRRKAKDDGGEKLL